MTDMKMWEQRVAAWRSSGLSARAFSEGREYSVHMLRYWARHVGPKPGAPAPASRAVAPPVARPAVRMARVLRTGISTPPPPTASSAVVIEIGRARVAVAAGFDHSTLAAVLSLLGAEVGR